jgi:hypothetical protein
VNLLFEKGEIMDYTTPMQAFARYIRQGDTDPERYYTLCHQLLGCGEVLPSAVKAELVDNEGLDADATTYHEAAVSALTEHVIDLQEPSTWQQELMPIYIADMAFIMGTASPKGFRAWLAAMVDEDDLIEALGEAS